jgi:hypothetical protein
VIIIEVVLVKRSVKTTLVVLSKKRTIRTARDIGVYMIMRLSLLESVGGIYTWGSFNAIEGVLRKRDHI